MARGFKGKGLMGLKKGGLKGDSKHYFILKMREKGFILNSTPLESCFVFWISFFETREVRL